MTEVLDHLRCVLEPASDDQQLVRDFAQRRDEAAFAALVRRHGHVVLGVCRRVLGDVHDAEDTFQATFLVLARKAVALQRQHSVGSFLYGVAYRLALKARVSAARRQRHESQVVSTARADTEDLTWREVRTVIDEELNRLADKLRLPLVWCYLGGKTQDEAARALGWSLATFRRRLDQGRQRLRLRLEQRGVGLSGALLAALLTQNAVSAVPHVLLINTVQAALAFTAGTSAVTPAVTLAREVLNAMLLTRLKIAAVMLLALGLLGLGAGVRWQRAARGAAPGAAADDSPPADGEFVLRRATSPEEADDDPPMPRRLLAICASNYLYANPVQYGGSGDRALHRLASRGLRGLGAVLAIPETQTALLSDKAPVPYPPSKAIVEATLGDFLGSCREQERIVILFVGHAIELNDTPYLVPLDGELDKKHTLIPLSWLYERLEKCKARQKVLILDVCRLDPARGVERGRVEKMSDGFDAALTKPPQGVEVLTACTAGQFSYEVDRKGGEVEGGVFLSQIAALNAKGGLKNVEPKPDKPLPMDALASVLTARTRTTVKDLLRQEQTPRLTGKEAASDLAYDPRMGKVARPPISYAPDKEALTTHGAVMSILRLYQEVPPLRQTEKTINQLRFEVLPHYPKLALLPYLEEGKETELRKQVGDAVKLLAKHSTAFPDTFPPLPATPQQKNQYSVQIAQQQMNLAIVYAELERMYEELKDVAETHGAKETKQWPASADYAMAMLLYRMAYFYEYNTMLAQIRKEKLPALDLQIHKGYKLAATAKVTLADEDAQKLADQARKLLKKLAEDHKGTPWEVIAKRELLTNLGLEWQSY